MDRFLQAFCVPFLDAGAGLYQAPQQEVERKVAEFVRLLEEGLGQKETNAPRGVEQKQRTGTGDLMLDSKWYENLGLGDVFEKVEAGVRLDIEDGVRLFDCPDVVAVGALAHRVRTRRHGNNAYYVMNQHINYSNICVNGCRLLRLRKGEGRSPSLPVDP